MNVEIKESKEPLGWFITLNKDTFKTYRYILKAENRFVYVNPFGDARDCPDFESFEAALDYCKEVVEKNLGVTVI